MSFTHRRSIRLSRSTIDGVSSLCPLFPSTPNSFIVEEDEEAADRLTGLLGTTWKLHTVSPLCTFSYDEAILKKYESIINQELLNLKKKYTHYRVTIELCPNFSISENDDISFRLRIQSKVKKVEKSFYDGVFLSWRNTNPSKFYNLKYVHLPLLLCNGSVSNIKCVHDILSSLLDCVFGNFIFSQNDFKWLSSIALSCIPHESSSASFIFYSPNDAKKTLSLRLSLEDLKSVWEMIKEGERITINDVMRLFAALQEHFLNTYNLNVDCNIFKTVSIAKSLTINNSGKIRINSASMMDSLLKYCTSSYMSRRPKDKHSGVGI